MYKIFKNCNISFNPANMSSFPTICVCNEEQINIRNGVSLPHNHDLYHKLIQMMVFLAP